MVDGALTPLLHDARPDARDRSRSRASRACRSARAGSAARTARPDAEHARARRRRAPWPAPRAPPDPATAAPRAPRRTRATTPASTNAPARVPTTSATTVATTMPELVHHSDTLRRGVERRARDGPRVQRRLLDRDRAGGRAAERLRASGAGSTSAAHGLAAGCAGERERHGVPRLPRSCAPSPSRSCLPTGDYRCEVTDRTDDDAARDPPTTCETCSWSARASRPPRRSPRCASGGSTDGSWCSAPRAIAPYDRPPLSKHLLDRREPDVARRRDRRRPARPRGRGAPGHAGARALAVRGAAARCSPTTASLARRRARRGQRRARRPAPGLGGRADPAHRRRRGSGCARRSCRARGSS